MYMRDVQDHTLHTTEQLRGFRALLQNILGVNLTLVGISQNEEVKGLTQASMAQADEVKMIRAWAAILFAPTLVGAVYGMNFDHMPEVRWTLGYPFALALMLVVSTSLYLDFKRRGWF
jgi:magnesium transporter